MDFLDLLKGNGITSSPTNMEPLTHPFAREGSKSFNFGNPGDFTSCVTESTLKLTLGLQRSSGVYANRTFILNGTRFSVHLAAARARFFFPTSSRSLTGSCFPNALYLGNGATDGSGRSDSTVAFFFVLNAKVARASSWQILVKTRDFCMVYPLRSVITIDFLFVLSGTQRSSGLHARRAFVTAGVLF